MVLEYIPRYGQELGNQVYNWGRWVKEQAEIELHKFFPKDPDGAQPIAYLWARTIVCEGPGCGAEVPMIRSLWLSKKASGAIALRMQPNLQAKRVDFEIIQDAKARDVGEGTTRKGSVTCPCCGYTTPVTSVRHQLQNRRGGAADSRLYCVVIARAGVARRFYRLPTERDLEAIQRSNTELEQRAQENTSPVSLTPDEPLPTQGTLGFRVQLYGMRQWRDLFTPRQLLTLTTLARLVREAGEQLSARHDAGLALAVQSCLAMMVDKQADYLSSLCTWHYHDREKVNHTFARQALPFVSDFVETVFFGSGSGNWSGLLEWTLLAIQTVKTGDVVGHAELASATATPLPDAAADALITDPPYYDAVPYAALSDFFYVWLKRTLPIAFTSPLAPKDQECIVDEVRGQDRAYFEAIMAQAMMEARRILRPEGIGIVVFAHKSTAGWEAQLQAMIDAGWIVTGSWPIDTEMATRLRARNSAALASSVHLVCRPRKNSGGPVETENVGDWHVVLQELPQRIGEWMPHLAAEGVVGADAIFACLGPALEVFSRYSHVEKANGDQVKLKEYLEHVWAAVAREALIMVFQGADATGFEPDARLAAMWLWTLSTGTTSNGANPNSEATDMVDEDEGVKQAAISGGYALEFDAARKIAQGLGADLSRLDALVQIKGDTALLLPVAERASYLFGEKAGQTPPARGKKQPVQTSLFDLHHDEGNAGAEWGELAALPAGMTVLDRLHQSMILFGAGRGEALRRFLVEDGVGQDQRFWRLAQAFSALYPSTSDEKRWVDGVLGRKKSFGF